MRWDWRQIAEWVGAAVVVVAAVIKTMGGRRPARRPREDLDVPGLDKRMVAWTWHLNGCSRCARAYLEWLEVPEPRPAAAGSRLYKRACKRGRKYISAIIRAAEGEGENVEK